MQAQLNCPQSPATYNRPGVGGSVRRAILRFIGRWLSREMRDARTRWLYGFEQGRVWLAVPITTATMYVLWQWAFGLSFYFGVSFVAAASLAILRGHVFHPPIPHGAGGGRGGHRFLRHTQPSGRRVGGFPAGATRLLRWRCWGIVVLTWLLKRYLETGQIKGRNVPRRRRRGRSGSKGRRRLEFLGLFGA